MQPESLSANTFETTYPASPPNSSSQTVLLMVSCLTTLNVEMQNYLIEISSLVKPFPKKRKEYLDFSFQLEEDMTLLQQEQDGQVLASMNYANAMSWFFVSLTVVGLLLYKN